MPWSCYNYLADLPVATPDHDAGPAARRDLRRMPFPCYSYPSMCFSYPDDIPRAGAADAAQSHLPSLRGMPYSTCFRY
jgi:hypothetical protein